MSGLAPSLESAVGEPVGPIKAKSAKQEPHAALPHSQFIRMLILEPGDLADPFRGRLESAAIDSAGSYEALSYVSGTSDQSDNMSIQF